MIRETTAADTDALMRIVEDSGQFDTEGLAHVRGALDEHLAGNDDALWLTADDGEAIGVAYCAPEPVTSGTWNLLMLWMRQDRGNSGHGTALVERIEALLSAREARLLIVETSGLAAFDSARRFYNRCGFTEEARIRDFFARGDDKLVYTKAL